MVSRDFVPIARGSPGRAEQASRYRLRWIANWTLSGAHSGTPAFRRPSINSFAFDIAAPRVTPAEIVKVGSTSDARAAASRASASRPRWAKAEARQRQATE